MIGTSGIDQENQLAHDSTYSNENWVDMNNYHQNNMSEYSNFNYMPPVTHSLPSESIRMPPPLAPQPLQPAQPTHPQLPHLIMPSNATWPSMLTNPNSYSAPPMPMPSLPPPPRKLAPPIKTQPQPRRTLTDDERKRMCQYHEDNPTVKQAEIGQMFGVERR